MNYKEIELLEGLSDHLKIIGRLCQTITPSTVEEKIAHIASHVSEGWNPKQQYQLLKFKHVLEIDFNVFKPDSWSWLDLLKARLALDNNVVLIVEEKVSLPSTLDDKLQEEINNAKEIDLSVDIYLSHYSDEQLLVLAQLAKQEYERRKEK